MNKKTNYIFLFFCNLLLFEFNFCCFTFKNDSFESNLNQFESIEYSSEVVKNGEFKSILLILIEKFE
jgi:hypothetical protein